LKLARPRLLEEFTWPQLAAAVGNGEHLSVLPIGATEQHGPHLPLSTDSDIATAICRAASERTHVTVLPTLWMGSSHAHTSTWPGTLSLPPRLLIDVVVELSTWVRAAGFTKLLVVNAHGGNAAPLRVAIDEIRCRNDLQIGLINWYDLTAEIRAAVTTDAEDAHANAAETSLMLHLRPQLVDRDNIRDDQDRTIGRVFSYTVAQTSREGLTGSPTHATAEEGERLFEMIVAALIERIETGKLEAPPAPGGEMPGVGSC
jgi:creatinine amidohydrolase